MKLVIDLTSHAVVGATSDPDFSPTAQQRVFEAPSDFDIAESAQWAFDGSGLVHTPPVPPPVIPPKVSPVEFKLLFTAPERIAIKTSTDPVIQDFFEIVNDPRLTEVNLALPSTQDALGYLAQQGLIAEARIAQIVLGEIK